MIKFILTILTLSLCSFSVQAETSVWKVSLGESVVYFAGTVHLLRDSDFPLPPEFDVAYSNSDRLVFETDIGALSTPVGQEKLFKSMTAASGQRVDQLLSAETMKKLSDEIAVRGMDINSLMQFKASLIIMILQMTDLNRLGVTLEGVDSYYNKLAIKDKKLVVGLETLDEQFSFLSAMGEGKEEQFVHSSLNDLDKQMTTYEKLIVAWRNGDRQKLDGLIVSEMKADYPEVYEQLLVQRNNNWFPKIKALFEEPGTEYILVGAGHLVGEQGILSRLENEGYKVTQLDKSE